MSIAKSAFGRIKDGRQASLYTIENKNGTQLKVSDFGATLVSIVVKDKNGEKRDVTRGYDDAAGYENGGAFLGACVGRNGNRIGGASFELNGKTYQLDANDGANNLHSGNHPFSKRMWTAEKTDERSVTLSLESPHMDQGFPGNVKAEVTYELTDDDEVRIHYRGTTDEDTILNMTNHSYFNLDGQQSGSIEDQEVWIDADGFTATDEALIPTGEIVSVEGTPMDLRSFKRIGEEIDADYEALRFGGGYDHNFAIDIRIDRKAAGMRSKESGILMEVYTDLPGVQFMRGTAWMKPGKTAGGTGSVGAPASRRSFIRTRSTIRILPALSAGKGRRMRRRLHTGFSHAVVSGRRQEDIGTNLYIEI